MQALPWARRSLGGSEGLFGLGSTFSDEEEWEEASGVEAMGIAASCFLFQGFKGKTGHPGLPGPKVRPWGLLLPLRHDPSTCHLTFLFISTGVTCPAC